MNKIPILLLMCLAGCYRSASIYSDTDSAPNFYIETDSDAATDALSDTNNFDTENCDSVIWGTWDLIQIYFIANDENETPILNGSNPQLIFTEVGTPGHDGDYNFLDNGESIASGSVVLLESTDTDDTIDYLALGISDSDNPISYTIKIVPYEFDNCNELVLYFDASDPVQELLYRRVE